MTRGPSSVDMEAVPDYDQRAIVPGTSDNQIQMFRRGTKAWACQWSGPSRTWVDVSSSYRMAVARICLQV